MYTHTSTKNKLHKHLIVIAAAVIFIAAVAIGMYINGTFLPDWIEWETESATANLGTDSEISVIIDNRETIAFDRNGNEIWRLPKRCKTQSIAVADVDADGIDDVLVLCWRIGRYGKRKPFWVKRDEKSWSQHIYIYDTRGGEISQKWMASDIKQFVKSWTVKDDNLIVNTSPEGVESTWVWISWGLQRLPDGAENPYKKKTEFKNENETSISEDEKSSDLAIEIDDEIVDEVDNETDSESVSIIMVGDILLHNGVVSSCKAEDGSFDFDSIFKYTKEEISDADIAIVNQEVILGGVELGISGYPSFNAPYEVGDSLVDAGFDVVCHGTNHALDRGKKGIMNCLEYWDENHPEIGVLGIYESQEERDSVYIKEVNGYRIAILNYTYGTNGISLPQGMPFAVNLLDKENILKDLEYAETNADFTVVCPHWGTEYQLSQGSDQEKWAQFMVENGADLIIGTHPHVIEPIEWVESENGNNALCYYSIGNYINWTAGRGRSVADRMVGGMASVVLEYDADGNVQISDYTVYPLVAHLEREKGAVTTYFLDDYSDELSEKNVIREQDANFSKEYCYNLCDSVWGDIP